jgi:hypothetical protein
LVIPREEAPAELSGILDVAKAFWESQLILESIERLSENGLSFETCGLLCDMPRSASRKAVAFALVGPPLSA